ncbi:MAG: diacylglycerol kinase family protein [Bdellovibrionota bacterium]
MKKLAILANPASGKGKAIEAVQTAKRALWGWDIEFHFPSSSNELRKICQKLNKTTYEAAVVIGGDGTMNDAIRGLIESKVPLCPFPAGTANDLAQELGISDDWNDIQQLIDGGQTKMMDLIEVNHMPFATVAGIGIGALLTAEYNAIRRKSPVLREILKPLHNQVYTALTLKTILLKRDYFHHVRVKSDTFDEKLKTAALFVCNQSRLGGDLKLAPATQNDDKKFNVLIIPRSRNYQLIRALLELKRGRMPKDFILFSTDRLWVHELLNKPIRVFGDGEILAEHNELEFKILPKALQVYRKACT